MTDAAQPTAQVEKNKRIVRQWVQEVFNEHQLDKVEQLKVPEYIDWNSYPGQDAFLGGFKAVLGAFLDAFPDFRYDVEAEFAEGDLLVCLGTWGGTNTGSFMGMPPTGDRMSARRVDLVRLAGDKMTERWGTGNELKMLQLMHMCPPAEPLGDASPEQIARRFVDEVLVARSPAAIEKLVIGDASVSSHDAMNLLMLAGALSDVDVRLDDVVVDGNRVTAVLTVTGLHTGTLLGRPPTHLPVTANAVVTLTVDDGQISSCVLDIDVHGVLSQVESQGSGG